MTVVLGRPAAVQLGWAVDVDDFRRWLMTAPAGAQVDYAGGETRPPNFPVVLLVREAVEAGLVRTHHRRVAGGWLFYAVRRAGPPPSARTADLPAPGSSGDRMYRILCETASASRLCPTNAVLAIALGLKGSEQARYVFGRLVRAGLISVENRGPRERRVVTICATGARTRDESGEAR